MTDCPWDLNGDGVVDDIDFEIFKLAYPSSIGDANWNPACDFNGDGVVDDIDFVELAGHYGPCPGVTPPPTVITCNSPTPNFSSGCALLLYYDVQKDGVISGNDEFAASAHAGQGTITDEEYAFVQKARSAGSINVLCPGCYSATPTPVVCTPGATRCATDYILETCKPDGTGWTGSVCPSGTICKDGECIATTPPPNMETRTVSLTEGSHTIQISLAGYDTLNATINVSSTGVTCIVGPCNTQGPPGVVTSGWTVTTYLKTGAVVTTYASWVSSKGGATGLKKNFSAIGEIIDGYLASPGESGYLGFAVTFSNIGTTIDYYLG